jgi:tetratricopeptide (TPR) repeat protein
MPERRGQMAAAALSLLVILLHGLVDDPLYKSRAVLFLFMPLAFASSVARPAAADSQSRRDAAAVGFALVLALAAAVLWRGPLLSRLTSNLAAVRQTQVELSDYSWPAWPIQDEVRRHVDLGPVVALYERALALDAGNASANRRLGQIELSLGQYAAAMEHLQAAYAAGASSQTTRQLLGEAYLANGHEEEGLALWASVSNKQAQLDIRVWWYEHIGDKERAEWMRWAASQPR